MLEVQLRLNRVGIRGFANNGGYGPGTTAGVKRFQTRVKLPATGRVDAATWSALIRNSITLRVPAQCRGRGWRICVNRYRHEATLFNNGKLVNSWLIRGGARKSPTRVGTRPVYKRYRTHFSSINGGAMPHSQFFDRGQALHGSVKMTHPFRGHSLGCVNFYLEDAAQLWQLTSAKRLMVTVYGAWS